MQGYKIGLDFGTTNSTISYLENDRLEAFQYGGPDGQKYIPSYVSYDNGLIEVGSSARETAAHQPNIESYGNFKMQLPLSESEFRNLFRNSRTPFNVTVDYLQEILISSENEFSFKQQQGEITGIVVSVPEIWQRDINNTGRENLQKLIAENLGFSEKLIQLVSEPVAAAAYYVWENQQRNKASENKLFSGNLLVCDMGGGTFDVSLCKISDGGEVEVLYFDGQGDRGLESAGVAFDRRCVQIAYEKKHDHPVDESTIEFKNLMRAFESRKISGHRRFTNKLKDYLQDREGLKNQDLYAFGNEYTITNGEVEEAFAPISEGIHRVIERVKNWLQSNNQTFDRLFMVGGFCQFYLVQQSIFESLGITDQNPRYDTTFNIANSAYAISFGSCLIANNLVNPSEKFIHSIGIIVNKEVSLPSIRGLESRTDQLSVTLINGNTSLDQLSEPIFENRPLIAHHPTFPVPIWIMPESKGERYTIEQVIDLPNYSPEAKYRVGMRVNRSQIAYLIIEEVDSSIRVEYELGNIITKIFPDGYIREELKKKELAEALNLPRN
jgi:molecular chaperone DnaK